jgi:ribonuclease HI
MGPTPVNFEVEPQFQLRGAKLSSLTQRVAYAGIKELRGPVVRKSTDDNISQIISDLRDHFDLLPAASQIWNSFRNNDFSRQAKQFLWKSVHSSHRIGVFWKHIPECEERGICQTCNETEDLEHILLKCTRPGQSLVWSLARELWLKKHPSWPSLSMGLILGCGLASFSDENGRKSQGIARLFRILISESAFSIWKIRNDVVIKRAGDALSENAIHNKWLHAINQRLQFDCFLTNHAKYGKQNSIPSSLVIQTWSKTLLDEENLQPDWTKGPRVLVGIEPRTSHPPSQPSGRRGRNR